MGRSGKAAITVMEILQQMDYDLSEAESYATANKAILGPESQIAEKLSTLMSSSPITAAHITIDVDSGSVAIKMNPLWEKLRDERESGPPAQQRYSGRKRPSKRKNKPDR